MDFIVIDTEGRRTLREIAVVNRQGKLIYEAFNREEFATSASKITTQTLKNILNDFRAIARHKLLVFHNAEHDLSLLKTSYQQADLPCPRFPHVYCTYRQAQKRLVSSSYGLEYLAKKLNLKVEGRYFNRQQAHVARYDAQFTHQLFLYLQQMNFAPPTINPFGSSRVDNPFQTHPDRPNVYQAEYNTLKSVIDDIKHDPNQQSKGAVVIGEPGTGKTHLIMRLAQQRLKQNRLLFIPCPNDAQTVKYHIYTSILESLNQPIPDTDFNQLEYFLANTFVGIIKSTNSETQKIQGILQRLGDQPLKLYEILGGENTQARRNNWDYIEKFISDWWFKQYGASGYANEIVKGIVKFCRYSNPGYRQLIKKWLAADELEPEELNQVGLSSWQDELSKEDFSLDAIAVLGKLALFHEPLIIVFDQLEMLGLEHNVAILRNFGEAVKEIFTRVPYSLIVLNLFPDRWQQLQQTFDGSIIDRISQYQVHLQPPTATEIEQILQLKAQAVNSDLEQLFTVSELQQIIGEQNSIRRILNNAAEYFRYKYQNIPLPEPQAVPAGNTTSIETRLERLEFQQQRLEQLLTNIGRAFSDFVTVTAEINTNETSRDQAVINNPDSAVPLPNLEPNLAAKIEAYLATEQKKLEQDYSDAEILLDEKDVGKLQDIIVAWQQLTELETDVLPSKRVFPPHRLITNKKLCIGFLSSCKGSKFTSRIQNFNQAVATKEEYRFILWRDVRSDEIKSKSIGAKEIGKLNNTKNGELRIFERHDRVTFELLYKFISDLHNQDLDIDLATEFQPALKIVSDRFTDYWLIKELSA